MTTLVLLAFSVDTLRTAPQTFTAMILIGLLSIVLDAVWRARRPGAPEIRDPVAPARRKASAPALL